MDTKIPTVVICANCKSFWHSGIERCKECNSMSLEPTSPSNVEYIKWVATDLDNFQFGRQLRKKVFEFKEYTGDNRDEITSLDEALTKKEFWTHCIIDLDTYSEEKKEKIAKAYYENLAELKESCGQFWEWVLAECIFEIEESDLY